MWLLKFLSASWRLASSVRDLFSPESLYVRLSKTSTFKKCHAAIEDWPILRNRWFVVSAIAGIQAVAWSLVVVWGLVTSLFAVSVTTAVLSLLVKVVGQPSQITKMLEVKSAREMSYGSALLNTGSYLMWLLFGIRSHNFTIILAQGIGVVGAIVIQNLLLWFMTPELSMKARLADQEAAGQRVYYLLQPDGQTWRLATQTDWAAVDVEDRYGVVVCPRYIGPNATWAEISAACTN
jgi:uncharacterized protein with PQ loop repeat